MTDTDTKQDGQGAGMQDEAMFEVPGWRLTELRDQLTAAQARIAELERDKAAWIGLQRGSVAALSARVKALEEALRRADKTLRSSLSIRSTVDLAVRIAGVAADIRTALTSPNPSAEKGGDHLPRCDCGHLMEVCRLPNCEQGAD